MTDRKTLYGGLTLIVLVPLLLLYQSSNTSKGTGPGMSRYNVDQLGNVITQYLYDGDPAALDIFCDYVLDRDGNGVYAAVWIDSVAAKRGECADVRAARGRLRGFVGDREGMRREFSAALEIAKTDEEKARIRKIVERSRK